MPVLLRLVPAHLRMLLLLLLVASGGQLAAQAPLPPTELPPPKNRYWDASADPLRQLLAGQRVDTSRLRTLLHLIDITAESVAPGPELTELTSLTQRLGRPEYRACRLLLAGTQLNQPAPTPAGLDSLKAAVAAFDQLGRPVPLLLLHLRLVYNKLNQQEERRAYYEAKRAYYQQRGARENLAACYHSLGGYYVYRADYNQAISAYLRAADLYRTFSQRLYYSGLGVIGTHYALWGNQAQALHFLRQVEGRPNTSVRYLVYRSIAAQHLARRDYPAALRYAGHALRPVPDIEFDAEESAALNRAYGLTLKSEVLLAQGRRAEAGRLLPEAQHLADSLALPITSSQGNFELDAAWARYYASGGQPARAEAYWLTAYRKARVARSAALRLNYLRELARHYQGRGQTAPAARYALAAVALADTLSAAQGALHVAQYQIERADRAQTARIASLRESQLQDAARARRQRLLLLSTLAGLALLAGLGFVLWRSNRQKQQANELLSQQKAEIQAQRDQTTQALATLRTTQNQLIQAEKMASLGELTAGIAHEIQNPLNFVNNFSEVSAELLQELSEAQAAGDAEEVAALADDVRQNLGKIHQHGQRAAAIVRGMLEHSRASSGERTPTDLNALADEYLRMAYQGVRAKDKGFNCDLRTDLATDLPLVNAVGADLGRVLLNLLGNAFYAVRQRQQQGEAGYQPTVSVRTTQANGQVEIRVSDNGTGMPAEVQQKIFQPFFTTKPTGEGTGLGLSLAYDIVAKGHGGTLSVESQPGDGTTFLLTLPL